MNSDIQSHALNAFVDGELDVLKQGEMEARMKQDASLRAQVDSLRTLRASLRGHADYYVAPAALRARFEAKAMLKPNVPMSLSIARVGLNWRLMVAAFGMLVLLAAAFNWAWWRLELDARLKGEVIASHVRSTLGPHLIDIASSDHHTVKPYLSSKLDYSPPVPQVQPAGTAFIGGRVDYLEGRPVAALVYRKGDHVVNAFVWPAAQADSTVAFATERGFLIAHWTRDQMQHWVISDLNAQEFASLVREFELVHSTQ